MLGVDCNRDWTWVESGGRALVGLSPSLRTRDVVGDIETKVFFCSDFFTARISGISGDLIPFSAVARLRRVDPFFCAGVFIPLTLFFCGGLIGVFVSSSEDSVAIEVRVVRCRLGVDVGVAGNEVLLRVDRFEGDSVDESALFRFIF